MNDNVVIVSCKFCEGGEKTSCLCDIRSAVENGKMAFMIHSHHVEEKVRELGYRVELKYIGNEKVPIGMWIMR